MTNHNTHPGTLSAPIELIRPDRRRIALAQLRGRLRIEINTGMRASSRGPSTLTYCYEWGYDGPRRKDKALEWVNAELAKYGN